ncbi:leucyl/phenylalanyl-tRNA--protein transferase [Albirhodobacter sp. R86504]|uniref:leucyl/phenylalanyl-tRNA--protein transferase n=1 Tax=Albirhodobacter sp. R86504 TaxID=3093848 RepID=UPI003672E670
MPPTQSTSDHNPPEITPQLLLSGYAQGVFPMAESRDDTELHWFEPRLRGVIPLRGLHLSSSLRKAIRRNDYTVRINGNFSACVQACAARDETWINAGLDTLYNALHMAGFAHSVEVWRKEGASAEPRMVGGLFGVTLGGAFFGESMFSTARNTSKIALAYLIHRLNAAGFSLCDTQFLTPHLASLGGVEIPRGAYRAQLAVAIKRNAAFTAPLTPTPDALILDLTRWATEPAQP